MKVLMVTPTYHPIKGGAEVVVRGISIKLNEMGIHTDVMTFNMDQTLKPRWNGNIEMDCGFRVFRIPALRWLPMDHFDRFTGGVNFIPGKFRNLFRQYDILHFHGADMSFPMFSRFSRKPKIFHLHTLNAEHCRRNFLNRSFLKTIADLYISLTKRMRKDLVELGISGDKIKVLPNGVDVKTFCPSFEKKDNLILFVGRIDASKGLHILLKSLDFLENPIQLTIIGPPSWNSEYFRDILDLVEKENRKGNHRITYLGEMNHSEIADWYQKASILVLPSVGPEALGVAILEALSCETPVVATNVGGVPEVLRSGENGILVPPNDSGKLAEAMRYLLDNESVRKRLGEEGRVWVAKNFSYEVILANLCQIYKKLTA